MTRFFRGRLAAPGADRVAPEILAFQTDIEALAGEPTPLVLRAWPALGAGLLAALLLAAALTRIDIVVTTTGRLMTEVAPVVLQPIGSAVLREMRVRPGETVEEGQILAVLDSTFTAADLETLVSQRRTLTALRDRLEAELADGAQVAASSDPEIRLQGDLQAQRRALLVARRTAIAAELDAIASAEAAEARSGAGLEDQAAIAREIEAMRMTLEADQVGSRLSVLTARAARLQADADLERHSERLNELRHRRAARVADLEAFERDWERQTLEELARVRPDLARVEEQLAKATRLDALTQMRAPRRGVVLDVARRSPGSLMREGEPVVSMVPSDVPLIAEVALRSADVGRLQPGDEASLKIDSFPWRRHGALQGELRAVSRESYQPEGDAGGPAMHRGQITIGPEALRNLPEGAALMPGMTLSADIKTGTRSVLEFFLEPILRGFSESLREP